MRITVTLLLVVLATAAVPARGGETVDLDVVSRIRDEGLRRSRVMDTLWHLTDLHGPRLTNSPQERRALAWARDRMTDFGLADARLEAWGEFGLGWSFERCVVEMTAPTYMPLIALPQAWTPGTGGVVTGVPVLIRVESEEDLEQYRGKLRDRIVLNGSVQDVDSFWEPLAHRYETEELEGMVPARLPRKAGEEAGGRGDWRRRWELRRKIRELLREEGARVILEPDGGRRNDYGVITVGSGGSRDPTEEKSLPQLVVATEHFNRVARLLERGHEVTMSVEVGCTFHDEDTQGYNVIAEIPGKDARFADQIVMQGYVQNHFADRDTMELAPEHSRLAAYFNLDNGGGMIRGIYLQQNAACRPIFEAWLEPFHDLGATTVTIRNTGGTDHLAFDGVGLPGFQFIQDPMDYSTRTHHTNMDLNERAHEGDLMQASVVLAAFVYHAATRPDLLPRKPLPPPAGSSREVNPKASFDPLRCDLVSSVVGIPR